MNIAILSYHRIGGSGIVAYEIGKAMAEERGHQVHFVGLEPPFRLRNYFSENMFFHKVFMKEYPVFDYQPYSLALASQLVDLIKRYRIEVIHAHYALPHAVAAILAKQISGINIKTVTTLHGTDITVVGAHPTMKPITEWAIETSDAVSAVSNHLRDETESQFDVTRGKIQTIYNFINPQYFNPDLASEEYRKDPGKLIFIHVSNLRPVKSPLRVIEIFDAVLPQLKKDAELWIVGEGPLEFQMMDMAKDRGIGEKVKFWGVCNNVGPIMAAADIMILPSEKESFGLAALESMACGTPVAAACAGGLPELIQDNENGILFANDHTDEAVGKIVRLANDETFYNTIRNNAIDTAVNKFNKNKILDQYELLYES
ncbi:MAG: N-acetyl-alpha-D-glucosaminyl L-malate synthase BshA [Calditrichia bacterium]